MGQQCQPSDISNVDLYSDISNVDVAPCTSVQPSDISTMIYV
jgi:hypothetical protein